MKYRVVAERPGPLLHNGQRIRNPFLLRDIFSPHLTAKTERRTWGCVEASDEAAVRKLFAEAGAAAELDLGGFTIVSIAPVELP